MLNNLPIKNGRTSMDNVLWDEPTVIPQPAAGAFAIRKAPGETFEILLAARCTMVTSAAVANRTPVFRILNGDLSVVAQSVQALVVPASTTVDVSWAYGLTAVTAAVGGPASAGLPELMIPPGFSFAIGMTGMQAGDQVSPVQLFVRRAASGAWYPAFGSIPYGGALPMG